MRVARVLARCARSEGHVIASCALEQLPATGIRALYTLRCLSAALVDHHAQWGLLQQQFRFGQNTAGGISLGVPKQFGSMVAASQQDSSGSESDADAAGDSKPQLLSPVEYRRKFQMWVDAKDAPDPCQTFEQANLPPALLNALLRHGFTAPTFIQAQAWPIAREGRDLVAIASTGSGKTAGFLLPAFLHIKEQLQLLQQHQQQLGIDPQQQQRQQRQQQQRGGGGRNWASRWNSKWNDADSWGAGGGAQPPLALVLAPTRELAQQIQHEAERLGAPFKVKNACLYGGAARGPQGRALARGPQLVIATPGRLLDFVNSGELNVSKVSMLILDEADRMLDMGFEPQIRELLSFMQGGDRAVPVKPDDLPTPPRQTLFFSATWPKEVQSIARQLCKNDPVRVFVGNVQEKLVANRDVTQLVALLGSHEDRLPALQDYIHEHLHGAERIGSTISSSSSSSRSNKLFDDDDEVNPQPRVVIFASTKRDCNNLAMELGRSGVRAVAVHGDKSQYERDHALAAFRHGKVPVLVATDVAARGLDIPGVTAVVNYEFPTDHDMYVHRIGRTGRAGRKGESLTLLTPQDASVTPVLVQIMREAGQEVPPELEAVAARVRRPAQNKHRYGPGGGGRGGFGRGSGGFRGGGGGFRGGFRESSRAHGGEDSWSSPGRGRHQQRDGRRDVW